MNKSNFIHAAIAVLIQLAILIITGSMIYGAIFSSAWFISREYTQREYKLHTFGNGYSLRWYQGFTGWSLDNWLDAAMPVVAVTGLAVLWHFG